MPQTARIFVSHNSQDAKWCHTFVAALRQTEVDVWYDEHNLGYGQLMTEIERELRTRPIFIVVLSPPLSRRSGCNGRSALLST